ncbi:MAG: ATP-dependent helicase HrpB [Hyphomonadaceae bacterium]|nr:ATP-dependent helicase HrpB [Hyphomonadaceae bacterium]
MPTMLPIDAVLPALRAALEDRSAAVLSAAPGAGKSTRTPLALLDAPWARGGKIILLAPRRIAARAAAAQMARLLDEAVGETVGYRVRLDSKIGPRTRIEAVTEGVFTRMIVADPALDGVSAVLLDEFHERSLEGDTALALARDAQQGLRPDLRLIVMSATLDGARVAAALDQAPVIVSEGRTFPLDIRYRPRDAGASVEEACAACIRAALREDDGDLLAFLPGAREIDRVAQMLRDQRLDPALDIHPLYAAVAPEAQDAAIAPAQPGRRKIVLATAIAETSLTIEGVRIVVDCGLARRPRYEPGLGLMRLETVRASQAAVAQRAGRAGRTAPGVCWRLWSEGETRALAPYDRPEILDADLTGLAMTLGGWGLAEPDGLTWLDPPPREAWRAAVETLVRIGARDGDGRLTPYGHSLATRGVDPILAHMIAAAEAEGDGLLAAQAAMLLSEQGLGGRSPDLGARLLAWRRDDGRRARNALNAATRLTAQRDGAVRDDRLGLTLARAFPDRIAKARSAGSGEYLMANGRGVNLDPAEPLAQAPYLVVADATGRADRTRVLAAAALDVGAIEAAFGAAIETRIDIRFDEASGAVRARRTRRLGALVLSEGPLDAPPREAIAAALLREAQRRGAAALPWAERDAQVRARVALLRRLEPGAWPDWSDAAIDATMADWLAPALEDAQRWSDLADGRLGDALLQQLTYAQARDLDALAPPRFETPAGGSAAIDYVCEGGPAIDVRVQEMFGLDSHPTIARGRVALLVRLLSPAHRPVQTTRDLPGFWRGSYAAVRADLRGRYPKHPWPDDPLTAPPTRRAKPNGAAS